MCWKELEVGRRMEVIEWLDSRWFGGEDDEVDVVW